MTLNHQDLFLTVAHLANQARVTETSLSHVAQQLVALQQEHKELQDRVASLTTELGATKLDRDRLAGELKDVIEQRDRLATRLAGPELERRDAMRQEMEAGPKRARRKAQ